MLQGAAAGAGVGENWVALGVRAARRGSYRRPLAPRQIRGSAMPEAADTGLGGANLCPKCGQNCG